MPEEYRLGVETPLNKTVAVDTYLGLLHNTTGSPRDITALGLILNFYH
jgi:hypothetical protein